MLKNILIVLCGTFCVFSLAASALAADLSAQQLKSLQDLPADQRAALAEKYGVGSGANPANPVDTANPQVVVPQTPKSPVSKRRPSNRTLIPPMNGS